MVWRDNEKKRKGLYIFDTKILTGGLLRGKNEFEDMMYFYLFKEENLSMIR